MLEFGVITKYKYWSYIVMLTLKNTEGIYYYQVVNEVERDLYTTYYIYTQSSSAIKPRSVSMYLLSH